jgi:hypothetical protein
MRSFIVGFAGFVALAMATPVAQPDVEAKECHLDGLDKFICTPKETDEQCFAKLQDARANNTLIYQIG